MEPLGAITGAKSAPTPLMPIIDLHASKTTIFVLLISPSKIFKISLIGYALLFAVVNESLSLKSIGIRRF